jgi:hypothetical protein
MSDQLTHRPRATAPSTRLVAAPSAADGGGLFALGMFVLSHLWTLIVRTLPPSAWALLSFTVQQLILWFLFGLVDQKLSRRGLRFAWAALAALYTTFTILDATLMRMTSLPLREILPMLLASQHPIEGLREIGLRPGRLVILLVLLAAAATFGGTARLMLARATHSSFPRRPALQLAWLSILPALFVLEQVNARDDAEYLSRGLRMPGYLQLYSQSSRSLVFEIPPPVAHSARARWLAQIGPARRPRHVLYVLLESFRADAIDPIVCPTLWRLAQQSIVFDRALAEATYTPLSWAVLLFDEAAHDNLFGRHAGRPEPLGSWLFAIMHQAGFDSHLYVSTNLTYGKTRERLQTASQRPLDLFQAAADSGDDPSDKNRNDRMIADHSIEFIRRHDWHGRPQFMLLQLDSTHYTYPFPEQAALFKPYSENLILPRPIETAQEALLLQNRYRNAAHYVDTQLQRVIQAFQQAGLYEDLAIVVTSDHGEGLVPGMQGHGAVGPATKRVPLLFKLPGRAAQHSQRLISHRDILPSLADYLGITLPPGATRGRAYDRAAPHAVLTIAPSGRLGQLTTAERELELSLVYKPTSVIVTPAAISGEPGVDAHDWQPQLQAFFSGRD